MLQKADAAWLYEIPRTEYRSSIFFIASKVRLPSRIRFLEFGGATSPLRNIRMLRGTMHLRGSQQGGTNRFVIFSTVPEFQTPTLQNDGTPGKEV
jgi:hypothetical protein